MFIINILRILFNISGKSWGSSIIPPSTKIETGWNAADTTSNQPKTGCFEAWSSTKPAKIAD